MLHLAERPRISTQLQSLPGTMSHAKRQREEGGTFDLEDSPPPTPTAADDSAGTSRAARLASRAAQRRRIREAGTGDASPIQLAGEDDVHEPFAGTFVKILVDFM